jgi:hypothetical protein
MSPNGLPVVCVTRGTRWGNRYTLDCYYFANADGSPAPYDKEAAREMAVRDFGAALYAGLLGFTEGDVRRELRGKNLACWCGLDQACHADVLLELANRGRR